MNTLPRFDLDSDGAVCISHTVATLNARAMFARLRSLAARAGMPPDDRAELQEELDELVDQTADVLWAFAGTVDEETQASTEEALKDAREDLEKEEARSEAAKEKLAELVSAASDTPDELQSKYTALLARQVAHDTELARRASEVERMKLLLDAARKASSEANKARGVAERRMGVWAEDVTAAQSSDAWRAKYELWCRKYEALNRAIDFGLRYARQNIGRSKLAAEAVQRVATGIDQKVKEEGII